MIWQWNRGPVWKFEQKFLRSGVLVGGKDEVEAMQGVHQLMADLLELEQLYKPAVELLELWVLNLSGKQKDVIEYIQIFYLKA